MQRRTLRLAEGELKHLVQKFLRLTGAASLDDVSPADVIGKLFPETVVSALVALCNRGLRLKQSAVTNTFEILRFIELYSVCLAHRCSFGALYSADRWTTGHPCKEAVAALTLERVKALCRSLDIGQTVAGTVVSSLSLTS
jgi:hypothetical protein